MGGWLGSSDTSLHDGIKDFLKRRTGIVDKFVGLDCAAVHGSPRAAQAWPSTLATRRASERGRCARAFRVFEFTLLGDTEFNASVPGDMLEVIPSPRL